MSWFKITWTGVYQDLVVSQLEALFLPASKIFPITSMFSRTIFAEEMSLKITKMFSEEVNSAIITLNPLEFMPISLIFLAYFLH